MFTRGMKLKIWNMERNRGFFSKCKSSQQGQVHNHEHKQVLRRSILLRWQHCKRLLLLAHNADFSLILEAQQLRKRVAEHEGSKRENEAVLNAAKGEIARQ